MKWLFSTLLIINLAMFIWLAPQQDDSSTNGDRVKNVGQLQLTGEPEQAAAAAELAAMEQQLKPLPDAEEEPAEAGEKLW